MLVKQRTNENCPEDEKVFSYLFTTSQKTISSSWARREILLILFQSHCRGGILASDGWKLKYVWTALWFGLEGTSIQLLMVNHGVIKSESLEWNSAGWGLSRPPASWGESAVMFGHVAQQRRQFCPPWPTELCFLRWTPAGTRRHPYQAVQSSVNVRGHTLTLMYTHEHKPPLTPPWSHTAGLP